MARDFSLRAKMTHQPRPGFAVRIKPCLIEKWNKVRLLFLATGFPLSPLLAADQARAQRRSTKTKTNPLAAKACIQ
jgi:hypothetical protein